MFEHGQLGMNSSLEDEEFDGVANVQEIMPPDVEGSDSYVESPQLLNNRIQEPLANNPRRSHSII